MAAPTKYSLVSILLLALVGSARAEEPSKDKNSKDQLNIEAALTLMIVLPEQKQRESFPPPPPRPKPPTAYPPRRPVPKPSVRALVPLAKQTATRSGSLSRMGTWLGRGGKMFVRFLPGIGLGLLAYDAYENRTYLYDAAGKLIGWFTGEEPLANGNLNQPEDSDQVTVRATDGGAWEVIIPERVTDDVVALRFHSGYLTVDPQTGKTAARADEIGDWEKFRVKRLPDGAISLYSCANGKYLSAANGGGGRLIAAAEKAGPWESFWGVSVEGKGLYLHTRDTREKWWCVTASP